MLLGKPLIHTLERMRHGGLVLDAVGDVLDLNQSAERILKQALGISGSAPLTLELARHGLKKLLRAGKSRFTVAGEMWVTVTREHQRQLILHAIQLAEPNRQGPHTAVVLVDLEHEALASPTTLESIFGLTSAEAKVAVQLAAGETLAEIAEASGTSIATTRKHLAAVFSKTQTSRQAELVALLARISMLP